jgi:predicted secreted Zn-dependent protease
VPAGRVDLQTGLRYVESLALLKILAFGHQEIATGHVIPVAELAQRIEAGGNSDFFLQLAPHNSLRYVGPCSSDLYPKKQKSPERRSKPIVVKNFMRFHYLLHFCLWVSFPAVAEVYENLSYKTYIADHKAGMSLLQSLNNASPIRENGEIFHGFTSWNIQWQYWWKQEPNGLCFFTKNNTTLTSEVTLPELVSPEYRVNQEFSSYIASLRRHELGHVDIARSTARKIDEAIISLPPMDSCPLLEQTANQLGNRLLEQARQAQRNYDQATQHGRTQGAQLNR